MMISTSFLFNSRQGSSNYRRRIQDTTPAIAEDRCRPANCDKDLSPRQEKGRRKDLSLQLPNEQGVPYLYVSLVFGNARSPSFRRTVGSILKLMDGHEESVTYGIAI
ncbi:unnamed protein product [Nezara viridula]|uniref:Uncharacterized protein n=1 Tax=Nezara viridula TaxID=85310 RepID=A0A9P0HLT9_NEZVI|nr:unnamed protein product [Nezara viridula]